MHAAPRGGAFAHIDSGKGTAAELTRERGLSDKKGFESSGSSVCMTGRNRIDGAPVQEGPFKFVSQDGDIFGEYTLTVVRSEGDPTPLSPTYWFRMNSHVAGGQQSNIIFKRNY